MSTIRSRNLPIQVKRISADHARALSKDRVRRGPDGSEQIIKATQSPSSWNAKTRSARFVVTDQSPDRHGDILITSGMDITEFQKNPMAFLFHDSRSWSVGTWANLEKRLFTPVPRMEGDLILHPAGGPVPEVEQTAWMLEHGGIRAASIGFLPDWDAVEMILDVVGTPTGGLQFNRGELVEISLVGIPANRASLVKSHVGVKLSPDANAEAVRRLKDKLEREATIRRLRNGG